MKTSYILIDYENVQPETLDALGLAAFKIKLFVGEKQPRMPVSLASALQSLGSAVEYIQISGSGRNALDMHIAYYIGKLSAEEPGSTFHVISKDNDYVPLIAHLKKSGIGCQRWSAMTGIAATTKAVPKAGRNPDPGNRVDEYIGILEKLPRARPAKLKTLTNSISARFSSQAITEAEVEALINELKRRGKIVVDGGKVTYELG